MSTITRNAFIASTITLGLLLSSAAQAVPAFARKHELNCSACHTAFPQLNAVGRDFKENGYRFLNTAEGSDMMKISDALSLDQKVPVSAILVARPYDKKDSGDEKIRALHEVEVIVAGAVGNKWSGYFELEMEDETGFDPGLPNATFTYNYSKEFNLQFAYGPNFWADSYGILNDHFRLTRGHVGAIDQRFGGADANGRFRSSRQSVGAYGRLSDRFFYNVNVGSTTGNPEGENISVVSGLINADVTDDIMVGAFYMDGQDEVTSRDFSRSGVQFQADIEDLRLQGLFIAGTDDRDPLDLRGPGEDDNNAFSLQAIYTVLNDSLRPTWVPLIRLDSYETNDGMESFDEVTLNLGYYFTQNIKGYVEYWNRYDAPTSAQEDSRITLQLVAGF